MFVSTTDCPERERGRESVRESNRERGGDRERRREKTRAAGRQIKTVREDDERMMERKR